MPYLPALLSEAKKTGDYPEGIMMTHRAAKCFLYAAIALLLAQCIFLYGNTGRDDAFFTYWPAHTLAEQGKILNYNGDAVEQSSTLLHTLLLGALHKILPFIAIPTLSWILSFSAGALTLFFCAMILRQQKAGSISLLALAATPSLVFWSSSGMETASGAALFTAVLLLCLQTHTTKKYCYGLVLTVTLAVMNRPEAFIVLCCAGLLAWLLLRQQHKQWLGLLLTTLLAAAIITAWRHWYFDAWFPQPVSAKSSSDYLVNALKGVSYIVQAGDSITAVCMTGAGLLCWLSALLYWKHPNRPAILVAGALALAQMAFIVATGGDWMDATRFLLPVLPALFLCTFLFLAPWKTISHIAAIFLTGIALHDSWHFAQKESTGLPLHEQTTAVQRYLPNLATNHGYSLAELQTKDALRDIPQLEHLHAVIQQLSAQPGKLNIASIQMGFIPYHLSKQWHDKLAFLDLRALSTRDFSDCDLLERFPRTENGIKISYEEFFALLPNLQRRCNIAKPDILYDMGYDMRRNVLQDNGYIITYLEKRSIRGEFSERTIGSELFVAVRRDLAAQFQLKDIDGNTAVADAVNNYPNIVFVIADDISYDNFGFMGSPAARTPTLDQLAAQGTVFTNGYVPTAFCRPSLATLLTGQWPHQNRIHTNNGVEPLPLGSVTLATRMQQHGYATFSGGKFWEQDPEFRGFDSSDVDRDNFARKNQDALWQFIDAHSEKHPLFIWWAPMLPHTPHNPPQAFLDAIDANAIPVQPGMPAEKRDEFRAKEKVLLAMNLWFDSELSKLQQKLREKQQLDNTLFVFLSDNGFTNRSYSKNSPYELGLRTPIVFSWPGHVPIQRIDAPTSTLHLYNTLLDYAGIPTPAKPTQGNSLKPVIAQEQTATPEKQFGADYQSFADRTDNDQAPRPERDIYALHVRDGDWKYIFYLRDLREEQNIVLTIKSGMMPFPTRNAGDEELYYLPTDPYEENNLAAQTEHHQRIEDYRREVLAWWRDTGGKPFDAIKHCPQQPPALCEKL